MTTGSIFVEGEIFLGRLDEQNRFREALRTVHRESSAVSKLKDRLADKKVDRSPFIFLVFGEGGMGKSKLVRRFHDIVSTEIPFRTSFKTIFIDWELKRHAALDLQVSRESIRIQTIFNHFYAEAIRAGWKRHFRTYNDAVKLRLQIERKVSVALERESSESRYAGFRDLGAEVIAAIVRRG